MLEHIKQQFAHRLIQERQTFGVQRLGFTIILKTGFEAVGFHFFDDGLHRQSQILLLQHRRA